MITGTGRIAEDGTLRFDRRYDAAVEDVWSALTDPDGLGRWLYRSRFEPKAGGAMWTEGGDEVQHGTVLVWEPPNALEYEWASQGEPPWQLRWELQPDGDGTMLVLRQIEPDPRADPSFAAGWHWHLDRLEQHLAGRDPAPVETDAHFDELMAYYVGDPDQGTGRATP
jgi:uncharacterized protein YndB with AHSA1/START domain